MRPQYLAKCGGIYSSEWFFSKILHCLRTSPEVFDAAYTWVECADWIPAMLTGTQRPGDYRIGVCAAGHKAMFNAEWGGYPDAKFLAKLDPKLGVFARAAERHGQRYFRIGRRTDRGVGRRKPASRPAFPWRSARSTRIWAAVGSGIAPGVLVKIIGTSTCDMMVAPRRPEAGRHPRPLRHRQRQHPARLLRPGGGPVGRGRYLQLVRQLHPAAAAAGRLARAA